MGPASTTAQCCFCNEYLRPICPIIETSGKTRWRFWRCPTRSCVERAIVYWLVSEDDIIFLPLPTQVKLFEAVAPLDSHGVVLPRQVRNILLLGSRGSSKSFNLRWLGHWLCLHFPKFQVLLLRRTFGELEKSHLRDLKNEQHVLNAVLNSKYECHYEKTGSQLTCGHAAEVGDEAKYLSASFDLVLIDEEISFTQQQIIDISTSCRPSALTPVDWQPPVVGGTNTEGITAAFLRAVYVDKKVEPDMMQEYDPSDYLCIESDLSENPFLPMEEYEKNLKKLSPKKYASWRYCDWDSTENQYFDEFRKKDIVENHQLRKAHVCPESEIPNTDGLERFCSMFWAYKKKGICLWWVALTDGTFYIEDEYTFSGVLAQKVAKTIATMTKRRGIEIRHVVAPDEMWNRPNEHGESLVETFRNAGLTIMRSKHDPIIGFNRMHALLGDNPKGMPYVRFSETNCPYSIRTIPSLIEDTNNPEMLAPRQEDAAAQAVRFGAMSRPFPTSKPISEVPTYTREQLKGKVGELRYTMGIGMEAEHRPGRVLAGGSYKRR